MVCGDESIGLKPQSLHYCQGHIFCGTGEKLMVCYDNERYIISQKALYRAPTFSLLLVSHSGISSCIQINRIFLTIFHVYTIGAMFTIM